MLKKIAFSTLFVLLNLTVFGQIPMNAIQVTIEESVKLQIKEYTYHVSNSKPVSDPFGLALSDFQDDLEDEGEQLLEMPKTISWMKEELTAAKFKCTVIPKATYDVDADQDLEDLADYDREVIEIRVNTLEELSRLSKFVLQLDDAHGELKNIEYEDISNSYEELFPAMMKKAKEKSSFLAKTAGKKIGNVIQITEGKDAINLYGDDLGAYMQNMLDMTSQFWKKEIPTHKVVKLTLKYVFELK